MEHVPSDEEWKIGIFRVPLQEDLQEFIEIHRDLLLVPGIVPYAVRIAKSSTHRLVNLVASGETRMESVVESEK